MNEKNIIRENDELFRAYESVNFAYFIMSDLLKYFTINPNETRNEGYILSSYEHMNAQCNIIQDLVMKAKEIMENFGFNIYEETE